MSDWQRLIRPQLLDLGPYVPGPSLDQLMAELGLGEVAELNWNEGLFGPLPGVLAAAGGELERAWEYPEHAYIELRRALGAEIGLTADHILPGHGIQTLILALTSASVSTGDPVVIPHPTYGLYAQVARAAGARVETVPSPELRLDLERIAAAAHATGARLVWICDPNNPTGSLVAADEWAAFLDAVPPGCLVAPTRPTSTTSSPASGCGARTTWRRAGRWSCCARSRRSSGWPACDSATRWLRPRSYTCRRSRSPST
jgi:histidinol-phosphate aminotransferase